MRTARNNVEQELEGVVSGADLYLRKPFSIRILELYIRNLLVLKKDRLQINNDETYKEIREQVKNNKEKDFYNKTIDIIIEHLDDVEFSVDHLVSEVAMGRTMFYQRIKKVSGMSAKELIRSVRMKKASELLATSDVTVSEVKDMVGFGSMSHFTQCFKKYYNCTPSEYVKRFES